MPVSFITVYLILFIILSLPLIKIDTSIFILFTSLLAGDDVKQKKPDPSIYVTAAKVVFTMTCTEA